MKEIPKKYKAALLPAWFAGLLFVCPAMTLTARAGDPLVEKKKTYSKSYTVSNNDKISFFNQFGELKINTWNRNEVKVDVTITAEASTDEKAQMILDRISIEDGKGNGGVYFKTKFNKEKDNHWGRGEKQGFHIDYIAYVPDQNPLDARNEFGPMSIGDYNGEVTLQSKFGSLTTGRLINAKKLHIEFGRASIGSIRNGNVEIKFSKATIDNLEGDVNARFEYCDVAGLKVGNDTKELNITNKFSNLYLDVSPHLSARFDISTSFGGLSNKTGFPIREEGEDDDRRYGPRFDKRYTGKTGNGSTAMKIRSEYGQVILGHNLNIDVDKNSNRNKNEKDEWDNGSERREKKRTTRI